MGNLKTVLEEGIMSNDNAKNMFDSGPSINEGDEKHFKVKTNLIESSDNEYDTHDCTITIKSNDEVDYLSSVRSIIDAMRSLREECGSCMKINKTAGIVAVIDDIPVFSKDKKTVSINFLVINNIERN